LVSVLAGATSIGIAFCAEPLLRAWTGDELLARQTAPILALYALGNGIFSIAAFPYYLQFAKGDLRLHVIGNAVFLILLVPLLIMAASRYGGIGAGLVWLGINLLSFGAWLPFVHRRFAPGLNTVWYGRDVGIIVLSIAMAGLCLKFLMAHLDSAAIGLPMVSAFMATLFLVGGIASSEIRGTLKLIGSPLRSKA